MPLREFGLVGLLQTSHDTLTLGVQLGGSGNDYISDPPDVRSPALFFWIRSIKLSSPAVTTPSMMGTRVGVDWVIRSKAYFLHDRNCG